MTPIQNIKIKYQRKNSLWNHLLTIVRIDSHGYSGHITQNGFEIWVYNHWTGAFYPVIYGKTISKNQKVRLEIKSKMNPLGQLISIAILSLLTYGIITGVIVQADNSWTFLWKRILIGILMLSLPIIAFGLAFRNEYKIISEKIKNVCQQSI